MGVGVDVDVNFLSHANVSSYSGVLILSWLSHPKSFLSCVLPLPTQGWLRPITTIPIHLFIHLTFLLYSCFPSPHSGAVYFYETS